MTDKEIIKALECCSKNPLNCRECGYKGRCNRIDCYDYLKRDAFDLINHQQAEIVRLKSMNQAKLDAIHDLQAQNEILSRNADTAFQEGLNERRDLFEPEIKAEAVKEFAESLCKDRVSNDPVVIAVQIELKEWLGDTE